MALHTRNNSLPVTSIFPVQISFPANRGMQFRTQGYRALCRLLMQSPRRRIETQTGIRRIPGKDIFMSEDLFLDGGPGLKRDGPVTLGHEMGHIWQFQNRGPEFIHTALADQHNHGSQGVGSGGAYDWLFIADQGVSFNNMGPESQAELASFIGQIIHPRTGQLNGDMANKELRKIFGNEYWMSPQTWAIVKNAHITLLNG